MLSASFNELVVFFVRARDQLPTACGFIASLWGAHLLNTCCKGYLNLLGIFPRHPIGLVGIPCCIFLHGNISHLFFNTIPLFVFSLCLLSFGQELFYFVSLLTLLGGGSFVWLFGRARLHIGASGLITGYFAFLLGVAFIIPGPLTLLLGLMTLYYFGGILSGLLPQQQEVSWESHLGGFIAGGFSAYLTLYHPELKQQFGALLLST